MSKHSSTVLILRETNRDPEKQEVLLVWNSPKGKHDLKFGDRWGLPGGKCCDDKLRVGNCCSETPEVTAKRETLEETGYVVNLELLYSDELVHQETREKFMRYTYLGQIVDSKRRTTQVAGEVVSPRWFKLGAFPKNSYKSHRDIIGRYFGMKTG